MFEERLQSRTVVPFKALPEGLYLMKRSSQYPIIKHYGVLVTGRYIRELGINSFEPIVIHQIHPWIKIDRADETGTWNFLGQVHPALVPEAMQRVLVALSGPRYNLLTNNCEQVARYIAEGERYSTQVFLGASLALLWALSKLSDK